MARLLVVEDDPTTARLLEEGLRTDGHEVTVEITGSAAILTATSRQFDVIATDVMLPDIDGFEICRFLRTHGVTTPILLLTARDGVGDRVRGLDTGADDYLVKPFAFAEFAARVRALLRRGPGLSAADPALGPLRLDTEKAEFAVGGRRLALSRRESALLRALLDRAGEPVERDTLLDEVWGTRFVESTIVDQYVRYVRRKLGAMTDDVVIETVRGVGYRLVEAP
ncbi:MAG: response regulator transcription factor [Acidobacteria bacterium]|nr:response regulator transcription factor [Acidobacteriota bacterium]